MKRLGLVLLMIGLACGSVDDKAKCASSQECPAGEWCASAEGERRCWPDAVAPVASDVTLTCGTTPCLRDGTLRVEAAIADDNEVLSAEATLDLDPSRTIALTRAGARWGADVPLRDFPFERFDGPVTARVVGVDGAKTRSAAVDSAPVQVTRLRWEYTAANALSSAAVTSDGVAVVGVSSATDQVLAVSADGTKTWSLTVGTLGITAAPAVGERAIWVGTRDGALAAITLDGSSVLTGVGLTMGDTIDGSLAVNSLLDKEWGFATSASGRIGAASTTPGESDSTGPSVSMFEGPVLDRAGRVCAVATSLRCYVFDRSFADFPKVDALSGLATGALTIDAADRTWTVAGDPGTISITSADGAPTAIVTLPSSVFSDSLVLTSNGDAVVGDAGNRLYRFSASGASVWTTPPDLLGVPNAPLILRTPTESFLVSTRGGRLFALGPGGAVHWSTSLAGDLRAPNIYTPPGQPAGTVLSTAYISSASGKLYAVIVDGELDASAPWPKAFHDPRNTNNALQSFVGTGTLP